jgi:2-polyprenyl-3-methyl-5-hydroxy-6-metoxy-1,4-benzoquinol methylase
MKSRFLADLMQLHPLDRINTAHDAIRCKVCGGVSVKFDIVDFFKVCSGDYYQFGFSGIPVIYYQCEDCSFIFTDFCDDWIPEDFAKFIYNTDYPLIDGEYAAIRPTKMADEMTGFLANNRSARILDYGSGTGVLAERLAANGFAEVENYDPFASPKRPSGKFDIVTCFETIEHSPSPNDTIADLLSFMKRGGCIIFSTGIQPANINELRANWWYIGPRNGHVSIYSLAALSLLGAGVGLELRSGGGKLTFAERTPSPQSIALLRAIGPTQVFARLAAPADRPIASPQRAVAEAANNGAWHSIEQSGRTWFRWTRTDHIEWVLKNQPSSPCRLTVTIPFVNEITPGFADRCLLGIGSRTYPVRREGETLTVTAEIEHALDGSITLITPEPQCPSDLRGAADVRALGLAIPLAVG